jgi:hypothetical protein
MRCGEGKDTHKSEVTLSTWHGVSTTSRHRAWGHDRVCGLNFAAQGLRSLRGFQVLQHLRHLEHLDLSDNCRLTDLDPVRGAAQLRTIKLARCTGLVGVGAIGSLVLLEELDLVGCGAITDLRPLIAAATAEADEADDEDEDEDREAKPQFGCKLSSILLYGCVGLVNQQVKELRMGLADGVVIGHDFGEEEKEVVETPFEKLKRERRERGEGSSSEEEEGEGAGEEEGEEEEEEENEEEDEEGEHGEGEKAGGGLSRDEGGGGGGGSPEEIPVKAAAGRGAMTGGLIEGLHLMQMAVRSREQFEAKSRGEGERKKRKRRRRRTARKVAAVVP